MNSIKTAFRVLIKNRIFSIINIFGFSIGIALSLLIALYVKHEMTYDHFNKNADNIYRLDRKDWGILGTAYGPDVKENISGVKAVTRINLHQHTSPLMRYMDKDFQLQNLVMADEASLDIFSFEFIRGNPQNALENPFSIVLTESTAKKIFGAANPIGKTLEADREHTYTVTGVIEDVDHFHLTIEAIAPFNTLASIRGNKDILHSYGSWNYPTYLLIEPKVEVKQLEKEINDLFENIFTKLYGEGVEVGFHLTALKDIYFDTSIKHEIGVKHGNKSFIYIFAIIGFFILVIASVNFINLSTAQAARRAKEVGVRKVVGGKRKQLIFQYLSESMVITFISFVLAIVLVELFEPGFSSLFKTKLPDNLFMQPALWIFILGGFVLVSLLAGLYPALYLTSFKPSAVLKGEAANSKAKGGLFRKILTVFQFTITVVLIITTSFILLQVNYMKKKDMGFEDEGIVYFFANQSVYKNYKAFRSELLRHPDIEYVSRISKPAGKMTWQNGWKINEVSYQYTYQPADPDYLPLMGVEMLKGQKFDWEKQWQKEKAYILNETAAEWMGLDTLTGGEFTLDNGEVIYILGIVEDFHFNDLHQPIGPLVIGWDDRATSINVKINLKKASETLAYIKTTWNDFAPEFPFNYHFLDDSLDELYKDDLRTAKLFGLFAGLAILIACLGLFGLSLFMSLRRTKEIGIRKVNGAKVLDVILLFFKEFSIWILIANAIAWPIAYFFIDNWLQNYPYRIDIHLWPFIIAFFLTLFVALTTVLFHTLKVAQSNPVNSLRYE